MKRKNKAIISVLLILTFIISFYLYKENKSTQIGKEVYNLTINEELKDVNFCGKDYKARQIFINGVDVGQKIANIITNNLIPSNIISYGKELKLCAPNIFGEDEEHVDVSYVKNDNAYVIKFSTKINTLSFSVIEEEIFYDDMYGGTEVGPIGNIK